MSVTAFCQRARVPASSFYYWRQRLRGESGARALPRTGGRPPFAEVRVMPEGREPPGADAVGESSEIELRLPGPRRIVVRRGFDRQTLLDLVEALEGGVAGTRAVTIR